MQIFLDDWAEEIESKSCFCVILMKQVLFRMIINKGNQQVFIILHFCFTNPTKQAREKVESDNHHHKL